MKLLKSECLNVVIFKNPVNNQKVLQILNNIFKKLPYSETFTDIKILPITKVIINL